jgi:anti-sigma B factor antagonist
VELHARSVDNADILELVGRLDAHQVPQVSRWFDSHPKASYIVVNLSGVPFVDSSGLAILVKGLKNCRGNGGNLYLCGLQPAVLQVFGLTRLDRAFTVFADEASALAALHGA